MNKSKEKSIKNSFRRKCGAISKKTSLKLSDTVCRLVYHSNVTFTTPITTTPRLNLFQIECIETIGYYHGIISRTESESLLKNDGDFLVRNSSHNPCIYFISCVWLSVPFHFKILFYQKKNKEEEEEEMYWMLENSSNRFKNLSELVNYYKYKQKSLSNSQTVKINNPIKCTKINLMTLNNNENLSIKSKAARKWTGSQPMLNTLRKFNDTKIQFLPLRYGSMPSVHKKLKNSFKNPVEQLLTQTFTTGVAISGISLFGGSSECNRNKGGSSDDSGQIEYGARNFDENHNKGCGGGFDENCDLDIAEIIDVVKDVNTNYIDNINPHTENLGNLTKAPPPKPSRVPTFRINEKNNRQPMIKVNNKSITEPKDFNYEDLEDENKVLQLKNIFSQSNLSMFSKTENPKKMSSEPTDRILKILLTSSDLIANCITSEDIKIFQVEAINHVGMRNVNGLELMVLPGGEKIRKMVFERYCGLKNFVIETILSVLNEDKQHIVISIFLDVALHLKNRVGNIFSFFSVFDAICSSQVVKLKTAWLNLRQNMFSIFQTFESNLFPYYKSLLDSSALNEPYKSGTVLPHVLPILTLMEEDAKNDLIGLDVIMVNFTAVRYVLSNIKLYQKAVKEFINKNNNCNDKVINLNTKK